MMQQLCLLIVLACHAIVVSAAPYRNSMRCEEMYLPMCRGVGYNYTFVPNQFNHDTQYEAGLYLNEFWPLIEIQCSPHIRLYLCTMYAPACRKAMSTRPLPVCRSLCESAKSGCAPVMRQYGFLWPSGWNCDRLPEYDVNGPLCINADNLHDLFDDEPSTAAVAAPAHHDISLVVPAPACDSSKHEELSHSIDDINNKLHQLDAIKSRLETVEKSVEVATDQVHDQADQLKMIRLEMRTFRQDITSLKEHQNDKPDEAPHPPAGNDHDGDDDDHGDDGDHDDDGDDGDHDDDGDHTEQAGHTEDAHF